MNVSIIEVLNNKLGVKSLFYPNTHTSRFIGSKQMGNIHRERHSIK